MSAVTVRISYRGKAYAVEVPSDASVSHLGAVLERTTGASVSTQKILGLKRATNVRAGTLVPGREDDASLLVADIEGLCDTPKPLMLMGTPATAIAALDAAAGVDHRVRGFEEEALRERRRRKGHVGRFAAAAAGGEGRRRTNDPGPPSTSEHPYTFTEYRALPVPAAIRPPASARAPHAAPARARPRHPRRHAQTQVARAAAGGDAPGGQGGRGESCVLGYNVNAGQEIHLRLRTDDLRGFRRYQRVRETLVHELTHNGVWSAHDANFKNLCSQLTRECAAFDWKQSGRSTRARARRRGRALIRLRGDLERGRGHGGDAREQRERARRREARRRRRRGGSARRRRRAAANAPRKTPSARWSPRARGCAARPARGRRVRVRRVRPRRGTGGVRRVPRIEESARHARRRARRCEGVWSAFSKYVRKYYTS